MIDLRSDTVTRPEAAVAERLCKQAALFVTSGTQSNLYEAGAAVPRSHRTPHPGSMTSQDHHMDHHMDHHSHRSGGDGRRSTTNNL